MSLHSLARRFALVALCAVAGPGLAEVNPFAGGWVLKSDGSSLGFQSVKNAALPS